MAVTKVTSSSFKVVVAGMLDQYSQDVATGCWVVVNEVTENAVEKLKHAGDFKGKKFRRAWKRTVKQYESGRVEADVHLKKPYYRIGHLLEHGHAIMVGGRKVGDTTAFKFIKPVEEDAIKEYEEKMIELIGKVV